MCNGPGFLMKNFTYTKTYFNIQKSKKVQQPYKKSNSHSQVPTKAKILSFTLKYENAKSKVLKCIRKSPKRLTKQSYSKHAQC